MSDLLEFDPEDLWYIKMDGYGSKFPPSSWGGYSQDFAEAGTVYSHQEVVDSEHDYWGVCGCRDFAHATLSTLIFDLDIHKAPDGFDSGRVSVPDDTLVVKTQNGGFHIYFQIHAERGGLAEADFDMTADLGWDIDIRGSAVKMHVVAPSQIPGNDSPYEVVNNAPIRTVTDPADAASQIQLDGESLLEYESGGRVGSDVSIDRDADPPDEMPTCYHRGLQLRTAAPEDHPNTHKVNVLTALCGLAAGYDLESIVEHFCDDFAPGGAADRDKTQYQLKQIERNDYSPPALSTLRKYGILDDGEGCDCSIPYHGSAGRGVGGSAEKATADGGTQISEASTEGDALERELSRDAVLGTPYAQDAESPEEMGTHERKAAVWHLLRQHDGHHYRVHAGNGEIYTFEDGVWGPKGERSLAQAAKEALGSLAYTNRVKTELASLVRSERKLMIGADLLGAPAGTVATEGGLLDLTSDTYEMQDLEPDHLALHKVPVYPDPEACAPRFEEFLRESVAERDLEKLQEYAGYILWQHAQPYGRALFILGPTDSGKGTFLRIIRGVLGGPDAPIAAESIRDLLGRWGAANLYGNWANVRNEVTPGDVKRIEKFKELTGGGDQIRAEYKNQDAFNYQVTQKFIFAMNQMPDVEDADKAFWNRLLFVKFPQTVPKTEQEAGLAGAIVDDEGAGVFRWMVDGLQRLLEQDGFSAVRSIDEKKQVADAHGDAFDRFKRDCLTITGSDTDAVEKTGLFNMANAYAQDHDMDRPWNLQSGFTRRMKGLLDVDDMETRALGEDGGKDNVFLGLRVDAEKVEELGVDLEHGQLATDTSRDGDLDEF